MNRVALVLSLIELLTAGIPAHAVKLRYQVKPGDTWKSLVRMDVKGKIEVMGMSLPIEIQSKSTTVMKVTAVYPDSNFVSSIEETEATTKVKVAGSETTEDEPTTGALTTTHSPMGKLLRVDGLAGAVDEEGPDIAKVMSALINPFPENEVTVGDTWEVTPEASAVPVRVKAKLLGLEMEKGREVARIEYSLTMTGDDLNKVSRDLVKAKDVDIAGQGITAVTVSRIDVATGRVLRSKGTIEFDLSIKVMGVETRLAFSGTLEEEAVE